MEPMKLLLVYIISATHLRRCIANQQQCANSEHQLLQGRAFPGFGFNDTESATNTTTPHVYGCRHLCKYDPGCIAMSYLESVGATPNCFLHNFGLGAPALVKQAASLAMVFYKDNCTRSYGFVGEAEESYIADLAIKTTFILGVPLPEKSFVILWTLFLKEERPGSILLLQKDNSSTYKVIYKQDYDLPVGNHTINNEVPLLIPHSTYVGFSHLARGSIALRYINTGRVLFFENTVPTVGSMLLESQGENLGREYMISATLKILCN